jgi:hypothetical protein
MLKQFFMIMIFMSKFLNFVSGLTLKINFKRNDIIFFMGFILTIRNQLRIIYVTGYVFREGGYNE